MRETMAGRRCTPGRQGIAIAAIAVLALSLGVVVAGAGTAWGQDVGTADGSKGSITISNASKGETYTIYKLFDATVTSEKGGSISYKLPNGVTAIPRELTDYFEVDKANNVVEKSAARKGGEGPDKYDMSDGLREALATWAGTATKTSDAVSDGTSLTFQALDFGYYVVKTTQGDQAITVTSTNRNATVVDKNSSVPEVISKNINTENVNIGDTVTYTAVFKTANYAGSGSDAKMVTSYTITDTLPDSLSNVTVTKVTIDAQNAENPFEYKVDDKAPQFVRENAETGTGNGTITIPWVDTNDDGGVTGSKYANGAYITVTYTATVTDKAAIAGAGNTNTVSLSYKTSDSTDDHLLTNKKTATFKTYALALKKVNTKGEALSGAVFKLPFYVNATAADDGSYVYAMSSDEYNSSSDADGASKYTDQITTPDSGEITVKGVKGDQDYSITEVTAPDGYNKLASPVTVKPVLTEQTQTKTTFYLDNDGNVVSTQTDTSFTYKNDNFAATAVAVVNKTGAELPSTGGMGTTAFYVIGGVLIAGAVAYLVHRRKASAEA